MPKGYKTLPESWCRHIGEGLKDNDNGKGKRSAKARRNMSRAHTGLRDTDATKRAKSSAQKGVPKSGKARQNMMAARRLRSFKEGFQRWWIIYLYSDSKPRVVQLLSPNRALSPQDSLFGEAEQFKALTSEPIFAGTYEQCQQQLGDLHKVYPMALLSKQAD